MDAFKKSTLIDLNHNESIFSITTVKPLLVNNTSYLNTCRGLSLFLRSIFAVNGPLFSEQLFSQERKKADLGLPEIARHFDYSQWFSEISRNFCWFFLEIFQDFQVFHRIVKWFSPPTCFYHFLYIWHPVGKSRPFLYFVGIAIYKRIKENPGKPWTSKKIF